ncbi:MAG: tRNA dihydrouridine synthase DusB [Bacteroidales bacterium]|nr:tRNA dihydrouridine synthase DusB [Bacteroidales bacterium]
MNFKDLIPEFSLVLAPMESVTNQCFRKICKDYGADILVSEFISSEALIREVTNSGRKMEFTDYERPLGIQIFGNNANSMILAAQIAEKENPDFIDINWGCPVKKIASKGSGSGILNDIPKMIDISSQVVKACKLPVTVKTRLGYDSKNKPIEEIAERLQDIGIQGLAIHGRTRNQMYKGEADWSLIGKIKENPRINIPIFGNGDIDSAEKAIEYKNRYGVDGILIGRAAIGNPFIFKQTKNLLENKPKFEPSIEERVKVCLENFQGLIQIRGEKNAINEMRKFYSGYFRGIQNFKPFRLRLVTSNDINEIEDIFNQIIKEYN